MHKFIHRRLMPSLLGFFFRFFYSGRFRFYGSFFLFFKLFEEVLFYLFLYRLSFIQVGCRYSSLFLSYLYLVSYNLSFIRIDCLYSSFFFLFFICFHIIFPLFNEAVFIHLFSFSFLFSFSLSFIHIGCLYSSLFFSFFIYFHIVLPLFKQSVFIRLSLLSFLFYSLDSLATRPSGPGCSAVISRTSAGRRRRPRMRQTTSRDAPAGGREAWSLLLMK